MIKRISWGYMLDSICAVSSWCGNAFCITVPFLCEEPCHWYTSCKYGHSCWLMLAWTKYSKNSRFTGDFDALMANIFTVKKCSIRMKANILLSRVWLYIMHIFNNITRMAIILFVVVVYLCFILLYTSYIFGFTMVSRLLSAKKIYATE